MPTQWVHQFRNCPSTGDMEVLVEETGPPRQVLARAREGAGALVDGYVLQSIDAQSRTALYTWVGSGEPRAVTEHLLELLAEGCPREATP
ncbi:hypothetical protein ACIF6L_31675 [Kitasatospora sp. NPDC086009]|uniref:hypothetical protein n=1 Tax=unclassified Kitasatospora TaxID=2633591 RepID=UPI0037C6C24A